MAKVNSRLKPKTIKGRVFTSLVTFSDDNEHVALEAYDDNGRRHFVKFTPTELVKLHGVLETVAQRGWFKEMLSKETSDSV